MVSGRTCLKIYCLSLGFTSSCSSFLWTIFQVYLLYTTDSDQNDLMVARYLDICFGLLGLSSSLALLYGAFVESKTWLTVWTLGSTTLIIGRWAWFFYQKYWIVHPESLKEAQEAGVILSVVYIALIIPVLINYKYLESNHLTFSEWLHDMSHGKICRSILSPLCEIFSSNHLDNIRQCANDNTDIRMRRSESGRDVIDFREDHALAYYLSVHKPEHNCEKIEKNNIHPGRSYRYMVPSNARPSGT